MPAIESAERIQGQFVRTSATVDRNREQALTKGLRHFEDQMHEPGAASTEKCVPCDNIQDATAAARVNRSEANFAAGSRRALLPHGPVGSATMICIHPDLKAKACVKSQSAARSRGEAMRSHCTSVADSAMVDRTLEARQSGPGGRLVTARKRKGGLCGGPRASVGDARQGAALADGAAAKAEGGCVSSHVPLGCSRAGCAPRQIVHTWARPHPPLHLPRP